MKKGVGQSEKLFQKKLQRYWDYAKRPLPQKQKNAFFDLLLQKNVLSAISKQPKSASQNTPFCPFYKGAQNRTNHIALIICALQTIFCIFAFLRFCVFVFRILTAKCDATKKGLSSGKG